MIIEKYRRQKYFQTYRGKRSICLNIGGKVFDLEQQKRREIDGCTSTI